MINERMRRLGENRSTIRELFEFGRALRLERGDDAVFDFSLGNPSVAPPDELTEELINLIKCTDTTALHGYTSAEGDMATRSAIANYIRDNFGTAADPSLVYMTAGAAGALVSALGAVTNDGESVIVLAPFFPEYKVFIERGGARLVSVPARDGDFRPDLAAIESAIDETTAAIIINSPNNPTGAVYSAEDISGLAELLTRKSLELNKTIYIIADEPYRELVYDGKDVPFIPCYYKNTIVCYSYSKSLSIPGERIGYVFVSPEATDALALFRTICGAGRALGYVCAPSLLQKLIPRVLGKTSDIAIYEENRRTLYSALTELGFSAVHPDGAFYLFVRSPIPDAREFSEVAKKLGLLLVPSDDFGCPGFVRLAYCQSLDMIKRSIPAFRALAEKFNLKRN